MALVTWVKFLGEKLKVTIPLSSRETQAWLTHIIARRDMTPSLMTYVRRNNTFDVTSRVYAGTHDPPRLICRDLTHSYVCVLWHDYETVTDDMCET